MFCRLHGGKQTWQSCIGPRTSLCWPVAAVYAHRVMRCCQCQVVVRTDDLELAGEVVQDAAAYLGLNDLESKAHFPSHMEEFQAVMGKVSTYLLAPPAFAAGCSGNAGNLGNRNRRVASGTLMPDATRHCCATPWKCKCVQSPWVCNCWRHLRLNKAICMQVAECNTNRLRMMAEAAESSMAIKILVVKVLHPAPH